MPPSQAVRQTLPWIERGLVTLGVLCLAWACLQWELAASNQTSAMKELAEFRAAEGRLPGESGSERGRSPGFGTALIGVLEIPRVNVSVAVLEGADDRTLSIAVGHLPDTPLPWHDGNSAMAGHRDTFFRPLKDLRVGDTMRLSTFRGDFGYLVRRILIVAPEDVWVLDPDDAKVSLTLITCYPFYFVGSAPQRFIVYAERVPGQEASIASIAEADRP